MQGYLRPIQLAGDKEETTYVILQLQISNSLLEQLSKLNKSNGGRDGVEGALDYLCDQVIYEGVNEKFEREY